MTVTFAEAKKLVLVGLYDHLHQSNELDAVSAVQLQPFISTTISVAFITRVLDSLSEGMNVRTLSYDLNATDLLYRLTDAGIENVEKMIFAGDANLIDYRPVPASDRIVSKSDNREFFQAATIDLQTLREEINSTNSVDIKDKDVIVAEISAAENLLSHPRFRLGRLWTLIIPSLRFLAEKFSSSAIGELAKKLIELLVAAI
jgi:hypothetical protein